MTKIDANLLGALRKVVGMARGYLVVDENVLALAEPLAKLNIHVITPSRGMKDEKIAKELLGGRIIVTKNPDDFVELAPVYDFGIIALDNLKYIDTSNDASKNATVKAINAAIVKHKLWGKPKAFKVTLKDQGASTIEDLD
jgi:hypothetical protein